MNPLYVEEVTLRMPRKHLSIQDVIRISVSYIQRQTSIHPYYIPKNAFNIAVLSPDFDGLDIGCKITERLPNYLVFQVDAMTLDDLYDAKREPWEDVVSPKQALERADIIVAFEDQMPALENYTLNPNRLVIHVKYQDKEESQNGNV